MYKLQIMKIYEIQYKYRLHTVKGGETLYKIALKYNVTAEHIKRRNSLVRPVAAGDMLYIDGFNKRVYTVRPLDTVESIAKRFNADAAAVRELNGIKTLYIGQRILI